MRPPPIRYHAYAKVNLTLEILGKRPDGYHDLASVVQTVSLADDLVFERADTLAVEVEGMALSDDDNLVLRAARRLAEERAGAGGARIRLVKRIPAAAGMGGGSSDAAATLAVLNRVWGIRLPAARLLDLALAIGSDVPYFLRGGLALMGGRGERLDPLPPAPPRWLVLAVPTHDVPDKTRSLYGALRPDDFGDGRRTAAAVARLATGQLLTDADLVSGFERAARATFPGLQATWSALEEATGRRFHLCGAGPTLFALAGDRTDAARLAEQTRGAVPWSQAVRTVRHSRAKIPYALP